MTDYAKRLIDVVNNPGRSKADKAQALREIRAIERSTGKNLYGEYNGVSRNASEMARWEEEGVRE